MSLRMRLSPPRWPSGVPDTIELANDDFIDNDESDDAKETETNAVETKIADNSDLPEPSNNSETEEAPVDPESGNDAADDEDNVVSLDHFRKKR